GGDTPSIIFNRNGIVFVNNNINIGTITGQCFVNGIIHYFINQVMETLNTDVANIHGWSFTNCFQSFQNLYTFGTITVTGGGYGIFSFYTHIWEILSGK